LDISKKKIALLIILLGIFINIISLPFLKNYSSRLGWIGSMNRMEIVLSQGTRIDEAPWPTSMSSSPSESSNTELGKKLSQEIFPETQNEDKINTTGRVAFPYKYIFLISVLLIFVGCFLLIFLTETKTKIKNEKLDNSVHTVGKKSWFKVICIFLAGLLLYIILKELWPKAWLLRTLVGPIVFALMYWHWDTDKIVKRDNSA
jgi:hypothetical protein